VMECVAAVRVVVEKAATPPAMVPEPIWVAPSRKLTLPEMVPAVWEVTVAVKATDCPTVEGFGAEVRAVVDAAPPVALTTCEAPEEWLGAKLESPG